MEENFSERKWIVYERSRYFQRYDKEPEEYFVPFKFTDLVFMDGKIKGASYPFVAGLVRKMNPLKGGSLVVSEVFPCSDDERIQARKTILKHMEKKKIGLTGDSFFFLNIEPGNSILVPKRYYGRRLHM